jgi:hypothetical protein
MSNCGFGWTFTKAEGVKDDSDGETRADTDLYLNRLVRFGKILTYLSSCDFSISAEWIGKDLKLI